MSDDMRAVIFDGFCDEFASRKILCDRVKDRMIAKCRGKDHRSAQFEITDDCKIKISRHVPSLTNPSKVSESREIEMKNDFDEADFIGRVCDTIQSWIGPS